MNFNSNLNTAFNSLSIGKPTHCFGPKGFSSKTYENSETVDTNNIIKAIVNSCNTKTNQRKKHSLSNTKILSQWDREWVNIGHLKSANLSPYNHCVGLYRHTINGQTMYVGRAIEFNNGGLRKRLSDYRRNNPSARMHTSGKIINEHLDEIITYVLVVGSDQAAAEKTKELERQFIKTYNPPWNALLKA